MGYRTARYLAREVKNVYVVLHGDLQRHQRVHFLHGPARVQPQARLEALGRLQRAGKVQAGRRRYSETVLVQLYRESGHCLDVKLRKRKAENILEHFRFR